MKIPSKNIILYIVIVQPPSTIFTVCYSNEINHRDKVKQDRHAEWMAAIHEEHWNNYISESVTVDMLSMTTVTVQDTPKKMGA